jgi:hypothetical protein
MGGSEACSQALKLETAKAATGLPARLQVVRAEAAKRPRLPGTKCHRTWQHAGSVGAMAKEGLLTEMSPEELPGRWLTGTLEMNRAQRGEDSSLDLGLQML